MTYFLELDPCLKKELVTGKSYAQKNVTSYRYKVTSRLLSKKESSFFLLSLSARSDTKLPAVCRFRFKN